MHGWPLDEGNWAEGGKVRGSRYLGLAVILEMGPEWAIRGLPLPQSLAGNEEEGSGGNPAASMKA